MEYTAGVRGGGGGGRLTEAFLEQRGCTDEERWSIQVSGDSTLPLILIYNEDFQLLC